MRETYIFVKGHNVDAIDKNIKQSNASYDSYQWDKNLPHIGTDIIKEKQYDLILAFDVIEHLLDLDKVIIRLKQVMKKKMALFLLQSQIALHFLNNYFLFNIKKI